ncbi:hypothetical chaperone protein [Formivibrio citricus]|uniref:Hypothetical chaperone protein n=1 Tax=Formivibrio citricus TaxID=83765 RepID=A0A1I4WIJ4_9NEIS|nr:Hsp70 family protein [Formivibrio citricus]SFN13621.1 hypothetical chaperone protein [Formivibrio citricus]
MHHACGLDFGTSNSTFGIATAGRPRLLPLEDGKTTLPSVVFFNADENHTCFGRQALAEYLEGYEGRLMRALKSVLGTSLIDGRTEVHGHALPFRELLAEFIGELKARGEEAAGQSFEQAVLGRPVHFVDDDPVADRQAQDTLEEIARAVGFRHVEFQFEPIAAAFNYEAAIAGEELVLVVDIGGGTSDFSLVRLSPERAHHTDRRSDILANAGVHIGGTDFDRALNLAAVMPLLGFKSLLANGAEVPSGIYFNLATWHTINSVYARGVLPGLQDTFRNAREKDKIERLIRLINLRAGHWLALQVEEAKIALSSVTETRLDLRHLEQDLCPALTREDFSQAIEPLVQKIESTLDELMLQANIRSTEVDTVFFTGGACSVPLLRTRLAAHMPQARHVEGDLFGSIGMGLALDAGRKFQ